MRTVRTRIVVLLAFVVASIVSCSSGSSLDQEHKAMSNSNLEGIVTLTMTTTPTETAISDSLELTVVAENNTADTIEILLWNTPLEATLSADIFTVESSDGTLLPYRGRKVKRATPPEDSAFVSLAPGETYENTIDLSRVYDLSSTGAYIVNYRPSALLIDVPGRVLGTLVSDTQDLSVTRY